MTSVSLSVVVPAYNYAHTLPRSIGSIVGQSVLPLEVIVIDDGSTDDTSTVINSLKVEYPFLSIRYIYQKNQGPSRARNHGIAVAAGDYILLLDADDELLPDAVRLLSEKADTSGADLIVAGSIAVSDDGNEKVHLAENFSSDHEENFIRFLKKDINISHGRFIVRKSIFKSVAYPENLKGAEDLVVYGHLIALCTVATVQQPVVRIHHHTGSLRHNVSYAKQSGLKVVAYMFQEPLPVKLMKYQNEFYVRRCLSLFRSIFLAGDYVLARHYYILAIKGDWKALLNISYLRKFLKTWFKRPGSGAST